MRADPLPVSGTVLPTGLLPITSSETTMLLAIAAALQLAAHSTLLSEGPPPARYRANTSFVITLVNDIEAACGKAPRGYVFLGCTRGRTVYMPNPCTTRESFARILCHEAGHVNGWPRTHGD